MRAAPAVDAALATGGPERMLIILLHAWAGAAVACWAALQAGSGFTLSTGMLVLVGGVAMAVLGAWLARQALPADAGRLRWDGQAWCWYGPVDLPLVRVVVSLDLGVWVLLHLYPAAGAGRARWRVASASGAAAAWHGLRVALAAHAGDSPPSSADQGSAGSAP